MIRIYSTADGKLFTDPKQHFYIDADLLREKAYLIKRRYLLDQIAQCVGYRNYSDLDTFLVSRGITFRVRKEMIASGRVAELLKTL